MRRAQRTHCGDHAIDAGDCNAIRGFDSFTFAAIARPIMLTGHLAEPYQSSWISECAAASTSEPVAGPSDMLSSYCLPGLA